MFLSDNWERTSNHCRDSLMGGVADYLARRYGNLQPNANWKPNAAALTKKVLDELQRHWIYWHHNRSASEAIKGCVHIVTEIEDSEHLAALAMDFSTDHPAIRALLLRRMPYLQKHHPELGWELFELAIKNYAPGIWKEAGYCLYYAYHQNFEIVSPWLERLYSEGVDKDMEVWGRISALSVLSEKISFSAFIADLKAVKSTEAWEGAASVWTNLDNVQQHREQCLAGLEAGLNPENQYALAVTNKFHNLFQEGTRLITIPINLIQCFFCLLKEKAESTQREVIDYDVWLNATSLYDPMHALEAAEIYISCIQSKELQHYLFNYQNHLTQFLTRLFAQAEEQEELDNGAMLQRVIAIQDKLLVSGVSGVDDWLKAAERP